MTEHRYVTPAEVASILKVHRATIYDWISRGVIPTIRIEGTVRIPARAFEHWLDALEAGATGTQRRP